MAKRPRIPVILSHKDGRQWTIGERSRRTRDVMCEAVKAAAPQLKAILGCDDYEFIFASGAPLRACRGEWTLTFGQESETTC